MPWSDEFDLPLEGFPTLGDAGEYIDALPAKTKKMDHWQLAAEMLLQARDNPAYIMFARIAMAKALQHGKPETPHEPRRKRAKAYRLIENAKRPATSGDAAGQSGGTRRKRADTHRPKT